jgi:AcrR family transcriptional regulator
MMSPHSRRSWIETGLEILGNEGVSAITIDRMTNALGVTKGSFYHHFKNIRQFREKLLEAWERDSLVIIQAIEQAPSPDKVLLGLLGEFEKRSPRPEIAIRAWAVTDPMPRAHMEHLDALRLAFLTSTLAKILGSKARGKTAALLLYSAIIGSLSAHPPLKMAAVKKVFREFFYLYGIGAPGGGVPREKRGI